MCQCLRPGVRKCHIVAGMNGRQGCRTSDRLNPRWGAATECHEHRTSITGRGIWTVGGSNIGNISSIGGSISSINGFRSLAVSVSSGIATVSAISLASAATSFIGAFQPPAFRESAGEMPDCHRCGRVLRFCGRFGSAICESAGSADHRRIRGDWTGCRCVAHARSGPPAVRQGVQRDEFGYRQTDDDGNGCDIRDDILARDLHDALHRSRWLRCAVRHAEDPYTGRTIAFVRGAKSSSAVQIDHVVALRMLGAPALPSGIVRSGIVSAMIR